MGKDDVFELLGLCLLALFGFAIWTPLPLLVFGFGALAAGRKAAADKTASIP